MKNFCTLCRNATDWLNGHPLERGRTHLVQESSEAFGKFLRLAGAVVLTFLGTQTTYAQINKNCAKASIYYYDVNLGNAGWPVGVSSEFKAFPLDPGFTTLASRVAGSNSSTSQFLGIDNTGISFISPEGEVQRYINRVPAITLPPYVPGSATFVGVPGNPLPPFFIPFPLYNGLLPLPDSYYDVITNIGLPALPPYSGLFNNIDGIGKPRRLRPYKGDGDFPIGPGTPLAVPPLPLQILPIVNFAFAPYQWDAQALVLKSPHGGESLYRDNPFFIDVSGSPIDPLANPLLVLADPDGSTSYYNYSTGSLYFGPTKFPSINVTGDVGSAFTTFVGGPKAGLPITKANIKAGAENFKLYTVDAATNEIYSYDSEGGDPQLVNFEQAFPFGPKTPITAFQNGPMAGVTVADAFANGVLGKVVGKPNITYLGVDGGVLPTPHTDFIFYDDTDKKIHIYSADRLGKPFGFLPSYFVGATKLQNNLLLFNAGNHNSPDASPVLGPDFLGVGAGKLLFRDGASTEGYSVSGGIFGVGDGLLNHQGKCYSGWDGPQANKLVMPRSQDPNFLGMTTFQPDNNALLPPFPVPAATIQEPQHPGSFVYRDNDGSLSIYDGWGFVVADYCWKTYVDGPMAGRPIDPSRIIDVEYEGLETLPSFIPGTGIHDFTTYQVLYVLDDAGNVVAYNAADGKLVNILGNDISARVSIIPETVLGLANGPLKGKKLADLVFNNATPGVEFLGVTNGFYAFAVCEQDMKVTKEVTAINSGAVPSIQYDIVMENSAFATIEKPTLTDNLALIMGCSFKNVASTTIVPGAGKTTATVVPTLNPAFSGSGSNTNIFDSNSGKLEAGQKITVRIVVNIDPVCGQSFLNVAIGGVSGSLQFYPSITPAGATGIGACTTINTATVGPDQTVCQDAGTVTLVPPTGVGAGAWMVVKGAGTVAGNVYRLVAGDYDDMNLVEVVQLKWVPTAPPTCTIIDLVTLVTVNHLPIVDAGIESLSCGAGPFQLSKLGATIKNNASGVTNGTWTTSGDGAFTANSRFSTALEYASGPLDIATGRAILTLTSDDPTGVCGVASDQVLVKFAGAMICIGSVNLSISRDDCEVTATPQLLLPYVAFPEDFKVQIIGRANPVFTKADIGKCFKVKVTNLCNNSCWGEVCIEDKQAPVISCPKDVTLLCSDLVGLNADRPCPKTTGDLGLDGVANTNDGSAFDCTSLMAGYSPAASCDLTGDEFFADYTFETSCQTPYASGAITAGMIDAAIKDIDVKGSADLVTRINPILAGGDVIKVIIRCWRVKDHYGNISAPCYQIIAVKRIPFKVKGPADKMYSCDGAVNRGSCAFPALPAGGIVPSVTGFPVIVLPNGTEIELTGEKAQACNIDFKIISETRIDVCAHSYKLIREFKIKDWCFGKDTVVKQEIKVLDVNKPAVRTTYTNFDRVKKDYCYIDAWGVKRTRDAFDVVARQGKLDDFTGEFLECGANNNGSIVTINALGDANSCNTFKVKFDFIACDPNCTKDLVTMFSNNSKILVKRNAAKDFTAADGTKNFGYTAEGSLSLDDAQLDDTFTGSGDCNQTPYCHDITFTAKDVCGYALAKQTFRIRLVDNVAPQAVCIQKHVASLTTDGTVRVNASTFNNGSSDNCGIQMVMVRRMTGASGKCGPSVIVDNCYRDYVDFVCADEGQTVMVEMLVVDQNCNINSCMVEVTVQNKQRPVCVAPAATEIRCTDVEKALTNLAQFGEASSYGNCGYSVFAKDTISSVNNCGVGSITRSWGVKNCEGVEITGLAACTQKITVFGYYDFTVDFPQDVEKDCAGGFETHAQLKARMLNPANFGRAGQDAGIRNDGCGVLVIGIQDDTLMATTGTECMKILRKICVYDWCVYQPNNDIYLLYAANSGLVIDEPKRIYRDAQGLTGNNKDGALCFIQVLKVVDKTAPDLVKQNPRDICFAKGACSGKLTATLVATDKCGATSSTSGLRYTWTILAPASGKDGDALVELTSGTGSSIDYTPALKAATQDNSPTNAGIYTIRWTASDLCGNKQLTVEEFKLTLKDCEGPAILVHEKVAELSYVIGQGTAGAMVMVDAVDDLLNNITDNCTNESKLTANLRVQRASDNSNPYAMGSTVTRSIMLNCGDRPSVSLRVWSQDNAGNQNWVLTTVKVQANFAQCGPVGPAPVALAGAVGTENGKAVKGTTITAKTNFVAEVNANTILDGSFATSIIRDQNYVVSASKVDASDKFLGVTTFDIAKISKHLLDIEKIATPYSLIAADVDMSGEIDGADMLKIRNFILRKSDNLNTNGTIWRFVDKSYAFKNAASPLTEDFSTVVSLTKVGDRSVANFVAVKLGDVNTTYTGEAVATVRNAKTLNFTTEDINVVAGNEYTVNIAAENFNAAAFQGTFSFTNATVKAAKGSLLTDANMAIFSNAITTSWNGNAKADDIMAITFVANKSGKLSEMLAINSSLTPAVANEANGTEMNVNLKFSNGKVAGGEFALNNASPNPVKFETVIGFNLPKDSKATLTVYTTEGKVLSVKNVDAKAGANQITLTKGDLNATGVMYYRLETADYSATKKMVVIE